MKTNFKLPFIHGIKRITSIVLAVMMIVGIFTALPFTASATGTEYYVTGSFNGFNIEDTYKLTRNTAASTEEYMSDIVTFNSYDELMVVSAKGNEIQEWFPSNFTFYQIPYNANSNSNEYIVYFRPNYNGENNWHENCIYLELASSNIEEPTTEPTTEPTSEPAGANVSWHLENGTLTISGTGAMKNYTSHGTPWEIYRNKITNVTIENGVTSIGNNAFYTCTGLTSITIPNSVTSIGAYAFYGCSFSSINLPNSITTIGSSALAYTPITSITIPQNVTSLGMCIFDGCENLNNITIPENVTSVIGWQDGGTFNGCAYYNNPNNWENNILYIGDYLVGVNSNLSGSCVIKNGTKRIAKDVFKNNTEITSITIPGSITYMGNEAFAFCSSLESVTIKNGVTTIDSAAFKCCSSLINVSIPDSVTSIKDYAFLGCNQYLNFSSFPDTLDYIDSEALFTGDGTCYKYVGQDNHVIWYYNNDDKSLNFVGYGDMNNQHSYIWDVDIYNNVESATFSSGITSIPSEAFLSVGTYLGNNYLSKLREVTIPNTVTSIGNRAFEGCVSLTSITIPDSVESIGCSAFEECTNLRSIIIPEGITTIREWAFAGCTNLSSVIIGNDVSKIGYAAFNRCPNANIVVPDTVKTINNFAFYDCNMIICPMDSYTYDLLTGDNFTQYRTSNTMVVGIVTAKSQLSYILRKKSSKSTSSKNNIKSKIITGAAAKYSTGEEEVEEEVLTPEQIAENLSHVQCYVVEDLDIDETLTFDSDLDVTLHLNDFETDSKGNVKVDNNGKIVDGEPHTLTASTRDAMIEVPGNSKLTIEATSESNGGLINTKGAVFDVKDGGSLTIKNGTYSEDVSKYTPDNKVMGKTNGLYTVLNPKTEDMTLDNDGREVVMPDNQDAFARNELVGVQMRAAQEREYLNEGDGKTHTVDVKEAMRFVSVVRSDILRGAEDYGYVLVKGRSIDNMNANKSNIYVGSDGCTTVSLKGSKNTLANTAYSSSNLNEGKYKYLTAAIKDIDDDNTAIGARFYIKRADGTYVYADYTCCATMGMIKAA